VSAKFWLVLLLLLFTSVACVPGSPPPTTTGSTTSHPPTSPVSPTTIPIAPICPLGRDRCPDPTLTPGEIESNATTPQAVCSPTAPARDPKRQLTLTQERAVLKQYGIPAGTKVAEYDHLIAYWAGGRSTLHNVWPERDGADKVKKDKLEGRLFRSVCIDHTTSLLTARAVMLTFWAYW